jgi:hypothetical protein
MPPDVPVGDRRVRLGFPADMYVCNQLCLRIPGLQCQAELGRTIEQNLPTVVDATAASWDTATASDFLGRGAALSRDWADPAPRYTKGVGVSNPDSFTFVQ